MNDCILQIEHVSKAFGKKIILKDCTLNIKRGEFVTILGASG
jgi:ABC-type Fe3+/spermidine/putrescine transport system ATPase subunit